MVQQPAHERIYSGRSQEMEKVRLEAFCITHLELDK